jgi:hypothetical protein
VKYLIFLGKAEDVISPASTLRAIHGVLTWEMMYDNIDNMRKAFGEIEEIVRWALETQEDGREGTSSPEKNKNPHWDLSIKGDTREALLNRTDVDGKKRAKVPLEARDVPTLTCPTSYSTNTCTR